jgi:Domain of unknown function (DUF4287)
MTYKAYIDNIKAKTDKSPAEFMVLAKKKGFVKNGQVVVKHGEILSWLKSEFGLGHGHANSIVFYLRDPEWGKKKIEEDAKNEKIK